MSSQISKDFEGNIYYFDKNLLLHRLDGPALERVNGDKEWLCRGNRHRIDGPAVEYADGGKEWWIDNKLHREDGPAFEDANGDKEWYYQGQYIDCNSQEEFERTINLLAFG